MQTIIQLSSDSRGIILMLLFFLLLVQLFEWRCFYISMADM